MAKRTGTEKGSDPSSCCGAVVHDALGGGEHHVAELTGGQQVGDPLLSVLVAKVKARGDHAALVKATVELHHDLLGAVVVDDLELANVAVLLHDLQELDDDLGAGADQHLALTAPLSVGNALESVVEHGHTHHD